VVLLTRWIQLYPWSFFCERNHAIGTMADAILSRQDGCFSTSMKEASPCPCWSSTPLCSQVIRSRRCGGSQRGWVLAGRKSARTFSPFLGGDASRKPASGNGEASGPDCFLSFCSGVCYVTLQALSSNTRFFRVSVVKGMFANCTRHLSL
jgi:hypothetical protein